MKEQSPADPDHAYSYEWLMTACFLLLAFTYKKKPKACATTEQIFIGRLKISFYLVFEFVTLH